MCRRLHLTASLRGNPELGSPPEGGTTEGAADTPSRPNVTTREELTRSGLTLLVVFKETALRSDLELAMLELEGLGFKKASPSSAIHKALDSETAGARAWVTGDPKALRLLMLRSAFVREAILPLGRETSQLEPALASTGLMRVVNEPVPHVRLVPLSVLLEATEAVASAANSVAEVEKLASKAIAFIVRRGKAPEKLKRALSRPRFNNYASHSLHYYKARFFPRLFRAVANYCLGSAGRKLLDPFVGSGTALVESYLMGLEAVGVDVDPLCAFMGRVKVDVLEWDLRKVRSAIRAYESIRRKLRGWRHRRLAPQDSLLRYIAASAPNCPSPARRAALPPYVAKKLSPALVEEIEEECARILSVIEELDGDLRDFFRLALSDAMARKLRFRFHGLGVGRFALEVSKRSLTELFLTGALNSLKALYAYALVVSELGLKSLFATSLSLIHI